MSAFEVGGGGAGFPLLAPATSARNVIQPTGPTIVPLTLKSAASQAVSLLEFAKSDGTVLMRIEPTTNGTQISWPITGGALYSNVGGVVTPTGFWDFSNGMAVTGDTYIEKTANPSNKVSVGNTGGVVGQKLSVFATRADIIPLALQGFASQSADLQQWQSDTPTVLMRVNKDGYLVVKKVAAPADGDLSTSELAAWFDDMSGAANVMFKAKDSGGTVRTGGIRLAGAVGLLATAVYDPGSIIPLDISTSSLAAFDTTNLTLTFIAPPSGSVILRCSAHIVQSDGQNFVSIGWVTHNTTTLVGKLQVYMPGTEGGGYWTPSNLTWVLTGLTPGTSYQFDLAGAVSSGTVRIEANGVTTPGIGRGGPVVMEAWSA